MKTFTLKGVKVLHYRIRNDLLGTGQCSLMIYERKDIKPI